METPFVPVWKLCAIGCIGLLCVLAASSGACAGERLDLSDGVVVVRPGDLPNAEQAAATVLIEEVEKRTGLRWVTSTTWPTSGTVRLAGQVLPLR